MDNLAKDDEANISMEKLRAEYEKLKEAYAEMEAANEKLKANTGLLLETLFAKEAKEKKYTAIIENSPGALFLANPDGAVLEVNQAACDMFGYTADEFRQMDRKNILDMDNPAITKLFAERKETGRTKGEITVTKKNGEKIWVHVSSFVFKNPFSNEDRMSTVMIDITERKKMEEALKISNERYVFATKATFDAIWDWDIVNDHLYWGEGYEKIFGYKISDKIDNYIHSFDNIHPDDRKPVFDGIDKLIRGNALNWTGEYRYKKVDGEYAYVQDKAIIIRDEKGNAIRMIGAMQDITARKNAEEELKEKNNQLKELSKHLQNVREEERKYLAREVHDELGQLAAVIKMDVDWLQIKMPDVDDAHKKRMTHASSTANFLITTIRKIASDLRPGMLDELGLNESLEAECRKFAATHGIACIFNSTFDDGELPMQSKTELFRICQESLVNVMRHASATKIRVEMHEKDDTVELSITDNGNGFDTSQKTKTLGFIGMTERCLSINGTLKVTSEIGKGTTVCAIIPKSKS